MRTFIAFEISDATRRAVARAEREMGRLSGVRWTNPASVHLTMKFLGDIEDAVVPCVFEVMREAVCGVAPFEYSVRGLGWFPDGGRPRVLWAGVEDEDGALAGIATRLNTGLERCGVPAEVRSFRPHLTLGRVRGRLEAEKAETAFARVRSRDFGVCEARELVLFMSELDPRGARHTRLGAVDLEEKGKEEV